MDTQPHTQLRNRNQTQVHLDIVEGNSHCKKCKKGILNKAGLLSYVSEIPKMSLSYEQSIGNSEKVRNWRTGPKYLSEYFEDCNVTRTH